MVELLPPGVEHGEAADLHPEMLRVPGDVLEGLGDRAKEKAVELAGVLQRQGPQGVRQGEDDVRVGRLEHLALAGGEPCGLGRAMAFGTAAVPAGVVRLHFVPTMVALGNMAAQCSGPTQRDGAEGALLRAREDGPIARQKGIAMLTHDIGHFQRRPTHGRVSRLAGKARASRGLSVAWSAGWATWR